jgi:hypothetical protein
MFRDPMFRAGLRRRLIGLAAAYALALQTLFVAVVGAASSVGAPTSIICSTGGERGAADAPALPAPGHRPGCAFCPLACGGAVALPSFAAAAARIDREGAPIRPRRMAASVAHAVMRAGLARAPPA